MLLLCGHQRSGTTLLRILCNRHPEMAITNEFANLLHLGRPYPRYALHILRTGWRTRARKDIFNPRNRGRLAPLTNLTYTGAFLLRLGLHVHRRIRAEEVEKATRGLFPYARVVGDKYPDYVWNLDRYVRMPSLVCFVIYRDCRDVASSALEQVRSTWRGRRFALQMDTAAKVARRWVEAIEVMEHNAAGLHLVRYETLIERPEAELAGIADRLGIDPAGFPVNIIRETSIGKYRQGLTPVELDDVLAIAGPTMKRLGYL